MGPLLSATIPSILIALRRLAFTMAFAVSQDRLCIEYSTRSARLLSCSFLDTEYLNGAPPKRKHGGENLQEVNKYSEIMTELKLLYEDHPGYHLYVTGHSLGASLAQLFAMEAAASVGEFIPKPVTTIK